jgi:hypothetical protein
MDDVGAQKKEENCKGKSEDIWSSKEGAYFDYARQGDVRVPARGF